MMTFVIVLIALVIERFFDWSHLRHWNWYYSYEEAMMKRFEGKSPNLMLAIIIVPLLIVVWLVNLILKSFLFGFLGWLFGLAIFIYCLGPKNLWADMFSSLNELTQGNTQVDTEKLKNTLSENSAAHHSIHRNILSSIFIEANNRVFAPLFWFVVLGPIGAVLYRSISLTASPTKLDGTNAPHSDIVSSAQYVLSILDWIPARIFTFIMALVSHFARVFPVWSSKAKLGLDSSEALLTECGEKALSIEEGQPVLDGSSVGKNALSLLDRVFIVVLIIIAILSLLF